MITNSNTAVCNWHNYQTWSKWRHGHWRSRCV